MFLTFNFLSLFLRVDKISNSGSDVGIKSYEYCIIFAICFIACDTLKNELSCAFPKLPFGCRSGNPMRIETCRDVSTFLRILSLVEQSEGECRVDGPR